MADTVETVTRSSPPTPPTRWARLGEPDAPGEREHAPLVGLAGGREGEAQQWETFPILTRTPASDVIRSGKRLS